MTIKIACDIRIHTEELLDEESTAHGHEQGIMMSLHHFFSNIVDQSLVDGVRCLYQLLISRLPTLEGAPTVAVIFAACLMPACHVPMRMCLAGR